MIKKMLKSFTNPRIIRSNPGYFPGTVRMCGTKRQNPRRCPAQSGAFGHFTLYTYTFSYLHISGFYLQCCLTLRAHDQLTAPPNFDNQNM